MSVNEWVRLARPARVMRMLLERDADLSLVLSLQNEDGTCEELTFSGVSELRFRGERTELTEIVLLLVEDIRSAGWDGVRFRVKDYEEEFVSFVCREITPTPSFD